MKQIELTQGLFALVDDEDFETLNAFNWCAHREGQNIYAWRRTKGKILKLHRVIMNAPDGLDVDHINGNGLDNQRSNLRLTTRRQNLYNMNKKRPGCTSQYRGVCFDRSRGRWMSYINVEGKRTYLGNFNSELEAALAHDAAGYARDSIHFTPNIKENK